ncbi:MAG TPA: hypothetical protein VM888_12585 [Chitinophagaceae bacterium]|jgi:hypothetical protein|nr:hypothetical protein [Chitinophagaceae bacterium]
MKEDKKYERPEAYPKPSETDEQLKNQPEYIDQEPNYQDKTISDIPANKPSASPDTIGDDRNPA